MLLCCAEKNTNADCELFRLRRDIWLGVARRAEPDTSCFTLQCDDVLLVLVFLLQSSPQGNKGDMEPPMGSLRILQPGDHIVPAGAGPHLVLCMTVARLHGILGADAQTLPAGAQALLERGEGEAVRTLLSPEQLLAGRALLDCPYEGAVRNMFFKSKVLELLAHFFGQLQGLEKRGNAKVLLPRESAAIAKARDLLVADLESPPSLQELARSTGTNETKLKRGFKALYGLAPYAYLRAQRMIAAREMLVRQGLSVSEAAMNVGYSNVSHFIETFTRHHGLRPGELLRSRCV